MSLIGQHILAPSTGARSCPFGLGFHNLDSKRTGMKLSTTDYVVIILFFAVNLGIGIYYARRGGRSVNEFFLNKAT